MAYRLYGDEMPAAQALGFVGLAWPPPWCVRPVPRVPPGRGLGLRRAWGLGFLGRSAESWRAKQEQKRWRRSVEGMTALGPKTVTSWGEIEGAAAEGASVPQLMKMYQKRTEAISYNLRRRSLMDSRAELVNRFGSVEGYRAHQARVRRSYQRLTASTPEAARARAWGGA